MGEIFALAGSRPPAVRRPGAHRGPPNERLVWTSALGPGYRPQAGDMPFTAVIELQPTTSGGTRYRVIAMHQNPADREQHDDMGFVDGWGAAVDQPVAHVKTR